MNTIALLQGNPDLHAALPTIGPRIVRDQVQFHRPGFEAGIGQTLVKRLPSQWRRGFISIMVQNHNAPEQILALLFAKYPALFQ